MKSAAIPANESKRLEAAKKIGLIDTSYDSSFDKLTNLAAAICQTPFAAIRIIDKDRQWFKSHKGLGFRQTPRDQSFCAFTILNNDFFMVSDTAMDDRFFDNPLVVNEPKIKFYAGAPFILNSGHAIGALCVIDNKARSLNVDQIESLNTLAQQVSQKMQFQSLISRLFEQEEILMVYSKMASLGQMVSEIVHEINNPLSIINMLSEQLAELTEVDGADKHTIVKFAERMHKATLRASKIVKSLRSFASDDMNEEVVANSFQEIIFEVMDCYKARLSYHGIIMGVP